MKEPSSRRFDGLERRRHGLRSRLRRAFHGFGGTGRPLASAELSGWAADLYWADSDEPPLDGAVFTIEQLELHARALAASHVLGPGRGDDHLLKRLGDSERVIDRCHLLLCRAHAAGRRMTPAAEWLLDNRWVIEEQILLAREHFPQGYSRRLPRLASGKSAGLPRIYDIILEFNAHIDARVDEEALARYIAAYQSVMPLTLGELWSVAIMLRLSLVENLRRVTASMSWHREHRERALAWAQRIDTISDKRDCAFLALADMVREDPPLSTAFVAQFTQALEGRGATTTLVLAWLQQRLADRGQTIEGAILAESHSQTAAHRSMANTISSLRFVAATEWYEFVEKNSATEKILRDEPAGVYDRMDFATRDEYRHVVEGMARRFCLDENVVARTAVALAATSWAAQSDAAAGHVGYLLVDDGKRHLERELRGLHAARLFPRPLLRKLKLFAYLGPVTVLSVFGILLLVVHLRGVASLAAPALALCAALAASQFAVAIVNWLASMLSRPRALPRMDFEHGIPDDCRTMVVVPTLLTEPRRIAAMMESLERRYLANRDPNLWFALLTDFNDADQEHVEGDDRLLARAVAGIEELNTKYGNGAHGRFFLFHRPRLYNAQERCWMGHERKRGKLEDFNALLCGVDRASFSRTVGDVSQCTSVHYVITLDSDTDLPWGTGWRLVGTAAHPLNRPTMDALGRRLVRGYAILQPRVSISWRSAAQSRYSRLMAGDVGFDPYTRLVSDLYQDLFKETTFIGKGIYDVGAFRQLLDGRFPDNMVLSHDLLESCYALSGQCSDVELLEDAPSGYLADVSRRHRWMRGDWQISPWLGLRVGDAQGQRIRPSIAALGWWKVFDNLRRALVAPAYAVLLALGWLVLPAPWPWTLAVLGLLFLPELLPGLAELVRRPPKLPLLLHLSTVAHSAARRLARSALWLTFLPFEAAVAVDAAVRSLWRVFYSRQSLLEWQTAAAAERGAGASLGQVVRRMGMVPGFAVAIAALLITTGAPGAAASASPVLLLWFLAPLVAWWISRPLRTGPTVLADRDVQFLRRIARYTWRYFEVFVGPQENWLPPDNFQEQPGPRVAHRTSPTDMGLALLSNLSAYDLGYLGTGQLLDRTASALDSMERMERYQGHFFNWYDTVTRKALRPLYISTVDSGNLVGHLRVLRSGLLELPTAPFLAPATLAGLRDTFQVLAEQAGPSKVLESVAGRLQDCPDSLSARVAWLTELGAAATRLAESFNRHKHPEAAWWADAFDRQVQSLLADLGEMAPWLAAEVATIAGVPVPVLAGIDQARSLVELGELAQQAADALSVAPTTGAGDRPAEAFQQGANRISERIDQIEALAQQCLGLADAEFAFLYEPRRKLLAVGYWTMDRRLDGSAYDLLASEARLASYIAIASGEIPFDHWFALGRRLTTAHGRSVLLSWSGSMFEYLMPRLVMPHYEGTLLDQACVGAVARQIEYGRQRRLPWGISESCYNAKDIEGTYQYRAFGVPGLGLQRGLADDVVVAPYASALALLVEPQHATANLRRMAGRGWLGPYGFYEAIDFTTARLETGQREAVVKSFFAHHHGMSLLALEQAVLGPQMQRRFRSNPDFQAATLLLQERIPKTNVLMYPHAREVQVSRRVPNQASEPITRSFTNPNTPIPEVHLLSNGRYHVMVSAAGAGYSRYNDLAITRWREDPTSETYGVFCFICDPQTHHGWSNTFQPTLHVGRKYEALFTPGRAEFRRQDDQVETHTVIAVPIGDDLEIRRIRLTNRSDRPRSLLVTGYAEVVLAPGVTDELHRVFSNLFVQTEHATDQGAILMTRRPRLPDEHPPWMFCMMPMTGGESGECTYETDRARFIGRGRSTRRPAALNESGPLSGTAGAVLDPCVAVRRTVELAPNGTAQLDLIIGVAPTRAAAMALIAKYQDHRTVDRVLEAAPARGPGTPASTGAGEVETRHYRQLASAVIFADRISRAPGSILQRNRTGQSGLWQYGISGDLPIVLLRVSEANRLQLVRDMLGAHAFWRRHGLPADLVIWNEDATGYRDELGNQILELVAAGTEAHLVDKPGGIFVRHIDSFSDEGRVLLQAAARIVMRDTDGSLSEQLERWKRARRPSRALMLAPVRQTTVPDNPAEPVPQRDGLIFANGTGGFRQDGREYIIDLPPGRHAPAPWVNVIANSRLGTVVSESGSAYTWFGNAQQCRLTPWSNDPVGDPSGEVIYIRDEASGRFQSPMSWPHIGDTPYTCRHGFGYSVFEHQEDELESELKTYVAVDAPVKFLSLKIRNSSKRRRSVSVFASVDLVLGDLRSRQAMHIVTELEPLTGAILARNSYSEDFSGLVAFFDCSEATRSISGDRTECLGRNGDPSSPAAVRLRQLSGRLGPGLDPCAAIQARVDLEAGAEREIVFILGAGSSNAEVTDLIQRHRGVGAARVALEEVSRFWEDTLGVLRVETPDAALNVLANGWLPYQVLSCRMWGRSGFYQSGGAYGFRDQLQDCLAVLHQLPGVSRQHLLRSAGHQFREGDVQHWWHPRSGRGVRTMCSDDFLWLPFAVSRYVSFTGDTGVLDEPIPFLAGRKLDEGEESYYDLPGRSEQTGTLYEHCTRAIRRGLKFGVHELPLMGGGDWNDGMNRVGHLGSGESVWLGFFLHEVLSLFAPVARQRGDAAMADECRMAADELAGQIEAQAWDGQWYRRAWFDSGEVLGSASNAECRIDSLPQSWATIAGVGDPGRRRSALDAVWQQLVRRDLGIVELLTPPFDQANVDPGYIKAYPPGVRENGGQYTHGAVWAAMAFALAGRVEQAAALVSMLNPINHARDPASVERYMVEPYVLAGDVYSQAPHAGRGGWTWYTGAAGWFYRLLHEVILGLEREADTLRFRPRVPPSWTGFTVHYRFCQTAYRLVYTQDPSHHGPIRLVLDGQVLPEGVLNLVNDRREHAVEVQFGPGGGVDWKAQGQESGGELLPNRRERP
jgi:cellobiose phosphorylase